MSGIAIAEPNELIANVGSPTPRALTVQSGARDPLVMAQLEMAIAVSTQNKLYAIMIKHLEQLTGEKYTLDDIEDPTAS